MRSAGGGKEGLLYGIRRRVVDHGGGKRKGTREKGEREWEIKEGTYSAVSERISIIPPTCALAPVLPG